MFFRKKVTYVALVKAKQDADYLKAIHRKADTIDYDGKDKSAAQKITASIEAIKAYKAYAIADRAYDKLWARYRKQNGLD